jgi:outer membrane immunogenic protein
MQHIEGLQMKKLTLALTAAFVAQVGGHAIAADMPARVKAPPPVVAPVASWTGCYVGGGGGYGLWYQENTPYFDVTRIQITDTFSNSGKGWFGTLQGGCDYQFGGIGSWQIVVGAFADYDFADMNGRRTDPVFAAVGDEKLSSQWAVGGRIGLLVTPQLLTYFSGGYTEAQFDRTIWTINFAPFNTPNGLYSDATTYKGWFLGSGYEYALGFLPGLYWKTEYRFSHLDRQTEPVRLTATGLPFGYSYDSEKWVHTVRSELVYRFNFGGAPLVAKY